MKIKNIFLTLIFCFCATYSVAQNLREFSVVSFSEKPFDTAARDERYKIIDGNGELFSIVKLVSNNPDDDLHAYSFDFGLCESRVKEVDGDVWVYVGFQSLSWLGLGIFSMVSQYSKRLPLLFPMA